MNDKITAYFKNGALYKIRPLKFKKLYEDRQRAYDARYIVSDGEKYDLLDIESVKSISIPKYAADTPIGSTGCLEYVLRKHLPTGDDLLDLEILLKFTKLLKFSFYVYGDNDWYRLPKKLYELGAFEQGDEALEKIEKYRPQIQANPLKRGNLRKMIENNRGKFYDSDLIEIKASYTRCEKCALYAGRIYSVNGEDKRFPKCPDFIVEKGCVCENGCASAIFPMTYFEDATNIFTYRKDNGVVELVSVDPISWSNRPFVDTRDDEEIERYYKLKSQREDAQIKSTYYMKNYRKFCYDKITNPKAPKSFSAYMRKLNKEGRYY